MLLLAQNVAATAQQAQPAADSIQIPPSIQVSTIDSIAAFVVFVFGLGMAWANLKSSVTSLEKSVSEDVKPPLAELRDRFAVVEGRVEALWADRLAPAQSSRALNERGLEILEGSGIKDIVDEHRLELEEMLRAKNPRTAYDAEREAIACVRALPDTVPTVLGRIKAGAFKVGADIDTILFVGGVYFRDTVLPTLGLANGQPDSGKRP
jgi:hypothetical protein